MGHDTSALPFEAADLFAWAYARFQLKADSELSRLTGIPQPNISKIRHDHLPVTSALVLEVLVLSGLNVEDFEKAVAESKN